MSDMIQEILSLRAENESLKLLAGTDATAMMQEVFEQRETLRAENEELKRSVDCVCGHHQHRSDESTGAARECLECDCKQFSNVHMAYAQAQQQLAELKRRIERLVSMNPDERSAAMKEELRRFCD